MKFLCINIKADSENRSYKKTADTILPIMWQENKIFEYFFANASQS